ncbi:MAG: hypothetical protein HKO89_03300 [Saprospiraceae bacterium]|nr:hypothetical protein [Saprospiraceae bacterium]
MTETKTEEKKKVGLKPMKIFLRIIIIFVLFIFLLPFLIHLGPIQNFLVDRITKNLSSRTENFVDVDKVSFSVFRGFELKGIYVSNKFTPSDTMIYVGAVSSSLKENLTSLFDQEIHLKNIKLRNLSLFMSRCLDEEEDNLTRFLSELGGGSQSSGRSNESILVDLNSITLDDINIKLEDERKAEQIEISLSKAIIDIDRFNPTFDSIFLSSLMLSDPLVHIEKNISKIHPDLEIKKTTEGKDTIVNDATNEKFFFIQHLELSGGGFRLDDWDFPLIKDNQSIDYNHLDVSDFNMIAYSTEFNTPLNITSDIKSMTLKESNGFEIQQLSVGEFLVGSQQVILKNFLLNTGSSTITEQVVFNFNDLSDFKSFAKNIELDTRFNGSKIAFSDLNYFFPGLAVNPFFKKNKDRWLQISGEVKGTINDMHADNLSLSIDNEIRLDGSLSTSDLTNSRSALINLYVDRLSTSLRGLKRIIPGFRPPEQFYKLDPIRFSGDIDGFFNDFVIYGYLESDLGRVGLDTRLDIKGGIGDAKYSGDIALEEFDLRSWTDNEDLGVATLTASVRNGQGLTFENAYADMTAELARFEFKEYVYSDLVFEGEMRKNLFNGKINVNDPNVNLDFDGQIDFSGNQFKTDFKTDIRKIDLKAINLSEDMSSVSGTFDCSVSGTGTRDFEGFANIEGLSMNYKGKDFVFDSLYMSSSPANQKSRNLLISSDVINASVDGIFDFAELVPSLGNFIIENHPGWAKRMKINKNESDLSNIQNFRFKIKIQDTRDYLELLNINDLRLKGLTFEGSPDIAGSKIESNIDIDSFVYKDYTFESFKLGLLHSNRLSKYSLILDKMYSGSKEYDPINIRLDMNNDTVLFQLITENLFDSIERVDLQLKIVPEDDFMKLKIKDNQVRMFSSNWKFNQGNEILLGENSIEIKNFRFDDGYRRVELFDYRKRGVDISLLNFNFELINGIIDYDKIDFTGEGDADLRIDHIFAKPIVNASAYFPELFLNDVDYGSLQFQAQMDTSGYATTDIKMNREEDNMTLHVRADYNQKTDDISGKLTARDLVMNTFEFIIDDGISNTGGTADINADIFGKASDIKLKGEAFIKNGTTTIDYLGAQLKLGTEKVRISETFIDLTNVSLYDKFGNRAIMLGGLRHDLFGDFRSQLNMSSERFMALDTRKEDNPLYYGSGIGKMSVDFSGPFSSTDIDVTAITGQGTVLNIPVEDTYENFDESFIKFVDRNEYINPDTLKKATPIKLEGVDIEMNLTITNEAMVNMIFNEQLNDVIKGRGDGDLRIVVSREGDFNIFGSYEVDSGDYLFTAWGVVAKPFDVKRGGLITWTGDPVNANLNIEAEYSGLSAPVNVFLDEYLTTASSALQTEAKKRTAVDLKMRLTGTLYNPVVNFDLAFPDLQGELRTFADNKVRTLRENTADLNEQVAGLIMFRTFLPSNSFGDNLLTSQSIAQTGYNTLSEFVSSQLSHLLSGLLQEALAENGFVSGIDFEIGFSRNAEIDDQGNLEVDQLIPDEIEVHFKPRFQNDRWGFDYGTSFVSSNALANYIIHDFVLEYYLTADRRLKLRAYGKWDKDEVDLQNEQKYGIGINYRKEFGSLTDFREGLKNDIGKLKQEN